MVYGRELGVEHPWGLGSLNNGIEAKRLRGWDIGRIRWINDGDWYEFMLVIGLEVELVSVDKVGVTQKTCQCGFGFVG